MDATPFVTRTEAATPVRWEPCAEPRLDEAAGTCAVCGWPAEDHAAAPTAPASRAA